MFKHFAFTHALPEKRSLLRAESWPPAPTDAGSEQNHKMYIGSPNDVVQFSTPIFYVETREGAVELDIMRMGLLVGPCKVTYYTGDSSATAGKDYESRRGEIIFEEGVELKSISIPLVFSKDWATTMEFNVSLTQPLACTLGIYLQTCRVKIISNSCFPSAKYANNLIYGKAGIEDIGLWNLYIEFIKLIYTRKDLTWRIWVTVVLQQAGNLHLYFLLESNVYMVDVIFSKNPEVEDRLFFRNGPDRGRLYTAILLGCLYIVIACLDVLCSNVVVRIKLPGFLTRFLKVNLYSTYLNFTNVARLGIGDPRVLDCIVQEVDKMTASFMSMLHLIFSFTKGCIVVSFVANKVPESIGHICLMVLIMLSISTVRAPGLRKRLRHLNEASIELLKLAQDTCSRYTLIYEYYARPWMCERFDNSVKDVNGARFRLNVYVACNNVTCELLLPFFIGYHIIHRSADVLDDQMSLGTFMASIQVFKTFFGLCHDIYITFMQISGNLGALVNCTELFNAPLELCDRKRTVQKRRSMTVSTRRAIFESTQGILSKNQNGQPIMLVDMIPLKLKEMSFGYRSHRLFDNVSLDQPVGEIVALCGQHKSGKSTLMKLLAASILTNEGIVFVPSHLRALYVPKELLFFESSAWENLTVGDPRADLGTVKIILDGLKLGGTWNHVVNDLIALGRTEEVKGFGGFATSNRRGSFSGEQDLTFHDMDWLHGLSYAQRAKLNLARALIVNPEILLLQRPLSHFDKDLHGEILKVLGEQVRNRGFQAPKETFDTRRPRTLFLSPISKEELDIADTFWLIDQESHVKVHKKDGSWTWSENSRVSSEVYRLVQG